MTGGRGGDISGDKNDKRATQTSDLWWYLVCMEKGERVKRAVKATLIEDIKKERKKKGRAENSTSKRGLNRQYWPKPS
jgi:hypothetical protein